MKKPRLAVSICMALERLWHSRRTASPHPPSIPWQRNIWKTSSKPVVI